MNVAGPLPYANLTQSHGWCAAFEAYLFELLAEIALESGADGVTGLLSRIDLMILAQDGSFVGCTGGLT